MNKEEPSEQDDNRTIADMNIPGCPWYNPHKSTQQTQSIHLTRKEKKALLLAVLQTLIPIIAFFAVGYALFLLVYMLLAG